jgi:hypothetical protein
MDPQTRKRKLISYHEKDVQIAKLKKDILIERHSHLFYKCMSSNNDKYIELLHKKMHQILPTLEYIKIGEAMELDLQKFLKANSALQTKFKTVMSTLS